MNLPSGLKRWATGLALTLQAAASAAAPSPLQAACAADQREREAHDRDPASHDWTDIGKRDRQRQDLAIAALRAGQVRSFEDHRCAALILLHAGEEDRLRLAFATAAQGELKFGDRLVLPKLAARAWDRLMMARRQPQWYATQFEAGRDGKFQLYPLAPGVMTEQERIAGGGMSEAAVATQLHRLNASLPPSAPPAAAAVPKEKLPLRIAPDMLRSALAQDEGLGNALVLMLRNGLALTPDGRARRGQLIFIPRTAAALAAFVDDPTTAFPPRPGSATPTTASGAEYRLEPAAAGEMRLVIGLDDAVQAAAVLVVTPTRWFEVTLAPGDGEVTALGWRRLPAS